MQTLVLSAGKRLVGWRETDQGALETECCEIGGSLDTKQAHSFFAKGVGLSPKTAHTEHLGAGSGGLGDSACGHAPMRRLAGMPELGKGTGQGVWP